MKFFLDESGDFRVPTEYKEHAVGVVVGVVVPETIEAALMERYGRFVASLSPSAFKKGEPKGNLLNPDELKAFVTLIAETEGLLICPTMLDLTTMAGRSNEVHGQIAAKLESIMPLCKHETMRQEIGLLIRQVRKLSPQASLRLGAWARCIMRCLQDSVIIHSRQEFNACWSSMAFVVDPVQPKKGSREEMVFEKMLPGWITAWTQADPMTTIQEIHTPDHPFVKNWEIAEGIDLGKIFRDNVSFVESSFSSGVQLADMAAYIARRAVVGVVTTDDLQNYGTLMSRTLRSNTNAHGIFSFCETIQDDISRRYYGIVAALSNARRRVRGAYALP